MKKVTTIFAYLFISTVLLSTACRKEVNLPLPQKPDAPSVPLPNPTKQDSLMLVMFKAVIQIGDIVYDSITAKATIITWDSTQRSYEKTMMLAPGTNEIKVPKSHVKFKFKIDQWGIQDEAVLSKQELERADIVKLGGSKAAKKLSLEESFIYAAGEYRPQSKTIYRYNNDGTIKEMEFYQKKVEEPSLKFSGAHVFFYSGSKVSEVRYMDAARKQYGYLKLSYNAQDKIENMEQKSYDQQTYAYVQNHYNEGEGQIGIDFLFNNGHAMEYTMKFSGGNKVEDAATTSRGGGEGGKYNYDHYINPYIHLNIPNLYLSHSSRNNMLGRQKAYSGAFPTNEPYKFEYSYDEEGYPRELLKSYKSYEGQHLYHTKTIYTY